MSKKIRRYSVLTLFSACLVLLLSLVLFHTTDSAFAQTYSRTFTVTDASSSGTNPHAAVDDNFGYVYVTYEEGTSYVDFRKSTNNGTSFSDAVHVGTGFGYFPRIAIDNAQEAYVIYTHCAEIVGDGDYWPRGFKSTHPGGTYSFSKILDNTDLSTSEGANSIVYCDMAVENVSGTDNVYTVWSDDFHSVGNFTIYFAGSTDAGANWNTPADAAISTSADARYPIIAVKKSEEDDVYVAWVYLGQHIMFDYSTNGGTAWQGADIQISDDADVVVGQRPGLAASSSTDAQVFAVWTDFRNGNNDVYFDYSSDGGTTWNTDVALGNSSYASYSQNQPSIAVKPGSTDLYAVWRDTRDGTNYIYFQEGKWQSGVFVWGIDKDAGGTIADTASNTEVGEDMRVSTTALGSEETPTVLANSHGEVYVIWRDTGAGIKCARYDPAAAETVAAPTGLTATGGDSHVWLSWTACSASPTYGAVYDYKIYRGTHAGGPYTLIATVGGGTTSYRDGSLTNGTKYYYVVTAVYGSATGEESGYSNEDDATANPALGYPAAPTSLTATAGDASVALAWTHTKGLDFDHYNIYRSTTRGNWGSAFTITPPVTAKSCTVSGTNGTTYWFVVTTVDQEGNESAKSNDAGATPNPTDTTAPDAPTNLQASGGDTMVGLTWSAVSASDLDKYHVYRSVASGVDFYYQGAVTAPGNWFFDDGLANGMTYYYVVTALDTSGNESGDSDEAIGIPRGAMGAGMGTAPGAPPILPEGGGGGGCFIATACYGSPLAGEVRVLSRFRDNCLLTNASGRAFVKGYYRLSPPIAGFIAEKPLLKSLVRIQLKPWVKIINAITN